ncbi:MAG: hypothetical protein H6612_08090 [Ignavibacteriales bacterium]|nr:hypothetical protein [Ignavibacteriales bacterium]
MNKLKLLVIIILVNTLNFAQGEGALTFTTFQQSTYLIGAGQIGVSIPNDDVLGYYLNPAILGNSARNNHVSFNVMPNKTNWFWNDMTFHNYGLNLGYDLEPILNSPIRIGTGFIHNRFYYGEFIITSELGPEPVGKYDSYDSFNCFSLGIGFDYFAKLNFGISFKTFDSNLGATYVEGNIQKVSSQGSMIDYGMLIVFPISELLGNKIIHKIDNSISLMPITNLSIGYSLSNIGDEIYYIDEDQKDPLSRTARLGYTLEFGYKLKIEDVELNLISYSFSAEANDIMVEPRNEFFTGIKYQSGIGDINISENLISLKANDLVNVHKGHIFNFLNTLNLTYGYFSGRGYPTVNKTDGIGFSTKGIFKLLKKLSNNYTINYISDHIIFEFFDANNGLNSDLFGKTHLNFDSVSLHFVGFEL